MSWTDERVERLSRLWAEGWSASHIATDLGDGVSRNAVIGKIHRLGLANRSVPPMGTSVDRIKPQAGVPQAGVKVPPAADLTPPPPALDLAPPRAEAPVAPPRAEAPCALDLPAVCVPRGEPADIAVAMPHDAGAPRDTDVAHADASQEGADCRVVLVAREMPVLREPHPREPQVLHDVAPPRAAASRTAVLPREVSAPRERLVPCDVLAPRDVLVPREPVVPSEVVIPFSTRVTILDLRETMCRWPLGDPTSSEFRFCGCRTAGSIPYCAAHARVAFQPVVERRRVERVARIA